MIYIMINASKKNTFNINQYILLMLANKAIPIMWNKLRFTENAMFNQTLTRLTVFFFIFAINLDNYMK